MKNQRIKTEKAAQLLGLPVQTLRVFIQQGKLAEFVLPLRKKGLNIGYIISMPLDYMST